MNEINEGFTVIVCRCPDVAGELQNAVSNLSQSIDVFHNTFVELDSNKYVTSID